jgi:hypothetical protein
MDKGTLDRMTDTVRRSKLEEAERVELLGLLDKLKGEIGPLSQTNNDDARSIINLAEVSTTEAVRENPRPEVLEPSLNALGSSVKSFEMSHPSLVRVVNSICMMLSDIGI